MHAIILAAGRGSRMCPLSGQPKCLSVLAGRTLLSRQMHALRSGGVTSVGIVRGYRADMIAPEGVTFFDNPQWAQTNMVGSLVTATHWLRQWPVIVSYGDIFYRHDLVARLARAEGDLVIASDTDWHRLWSRRFADPLSDAETFRADAAGRLVDIGRKISRLDEVQGQYMGLFRITPAAWAAAERVLAGLESDTRNQIDVTALLRRLLAAGFPISTLRTSGHWGEVDTQGDLSLYEAMIRGGELDVEDVSSA